MVEALASVYLPRFSAAQAYILVVTRYRLRSYLRWFWSTNNYSKTLPADLQLTAPMRRLRLAIWFIQLILLMTALALVLDSFSYPSPGQLQVGLALAVAVPIIAVHALALLLLLTKIVSAPFRLKSIGKNLLCRQLESQVVKLRAKNGFMIVAVAGSVGKTSTKLAIAEVLKGSLKVCYQEGNYNDRVTVPLVIFGHNQPELFDIPAWLRIIKANNQTLKKDYPFDVVVVELGTDKPGEISHFAYLKPDISVVTAIAPEHMEFFGSLDAVAAEELTVASFSDKLLLNADDTPPQYLKDLKPVSYGSTKQSAYKLQKTKPVGLSGQSMSVLFGKKVLTSKVGVLGQQGAKTALAAIGVADMLSIKRPAIQKGLKRLKPFNGRMNVLEGIKSSKLVDDTYNSSPTAVIAALDVLYAAKSSQRIALIGNMNELGGYSQEAHDMIGNYCDPKKLAYVLTIGPDANNYLAAAAEAKGCRVERFDSPYLAGEFIKNNLKKGAVVLAKGSQNKVFAEEALKSLLADPQDILKLVRQSPYWLEIKRRQFKSFPSNGLLPKSTV